MTANPLDKILQQEGFSAPPQDVCQGWYLRNRATNAELSELVPAAHLYAIMDPSEVENLVEYIDNSTNPNLRGVANATGKKTPVWVSENGNELSFDSIIPTIDQENFEQRKHEINNQLLREIIEATVRFSYSASDEEYTGAQTAQDQSSAESLQTRKIELVQLAQLKSQVDVENNIKGNSSSVGIDNLSTQWASNQGYSKIIDVALTFTNPDIIDINYAYQKLLTVNTFLGILILLFNYGRGLINHVFGTSVSRRRSNIPLPFIVNFNYQF